MDKPLVVHVLWTLGRAGAERMVFDLVKRLPERGFRVKVIAAAGGGEMEKDFYAAGIPLLIGPDARYPWQRHRTVKFLEQALQEERPDILHTHLGGDVWAGMVARRLKIHPWIATIHSDESKFPWRQRRLRGRAFRHTDHIVCVSDVAKYAAKDTYDLSAKRLSVIRIGVDLEQFSFHSHSAIHTPPRILCVGRFVPSKNHKVMIKGFAKLKHPWQLDLIGEGPEETSLKDLVHRLGLGDQVHFLGTVPDVQEYLSRSDVLCFPSKSEGQGMALLEAAANGLPIIASPLPVFHELFDDTSVLYAFTPSSRKAWFDALERVLAEYPRALERATHARQVVEQHFSVDHMVDEYVKLYALQCNSGQ